MTGFLGGGGAIRPLLVPPPVYVGPGDVVSGAAAWWGNRAYSNAAIGTNAIRLRRDSDQVEQDFVTVSGGGLDLTGISSFKGAANLFVVKLYDQTGNGNNSVQATAAFQPAFNLNILGSFPSMAFVSANPGLLQSVSTVNTTQPCTFSIIARETISGNFGIICGVTSTNDITLAISTIRIYAGTVLSVSATVLNTWHAIQGVFNSVSSILFLDGVSTAGDAGTDSSITDSIKLGTNTFGQNLDGNIMESGVWTSGFSAGQQAAMNTNQHNYWGF